MTTESRDPGRLVSWLYLDMNSFFASVEQEMNPALRGKPVAVVPLHADTTSCIAVSYEGKAFGVKTGTKVGEAKRLCPRMIFIDGDHANYVKYHNRIVTAVETCLPVEAVCSIDEIACRLTGSQQDLAAAKALALKVKSVIKAKVGSSLKCSIGLAPNRYLAKIAADMQKPDGLTALLPRDLPRSLHRLTLRDLPGVGRKMEARLNARGIRDMEKFCALPAQELRRAWGSVRGEELWHLLRGEEVPEKSSGQKSISHSHVLPPELRHEAGALRVLNKLTVKAAARLRQEGFYASGIQIFAEFLGHDGWKARCGLMETQDTAAFLRALSELWKNAPSGQPYGVGVALTGLVPESLHAPDLFENPNRNRLNKALDDLNKKFGKDSVHYGATHESAKLAPLRIAFTRIPNEDEG
ncbi:MAG TPA: DNA polymerase [Elusimicrobiota bacterium]|nr:DNA polymerase [Elusimicrobiota bacterium]